MGNHNLEKDIILVHGRLGKYIHKFTGIEYWSIYADSVTSLNMALNPTIFSNLQRKGSNSVPLGVRKLSLSAEFECDESAQTPFFRTRELSTHTETQTKQTLFSLSYLANWALIPKLKQNKLFSHFRISRTSLSN